MSLHSFSRVWLHLTWATLERRPLLPPPAAVKLSAYLTQYSAEKRIYMKINYVNTDHVHALIDLPTRLCIEDVMQLFKGGTSHWVNENDLGRGKFGWGRGYGVFSVSHSGVAEVAKYIANQEEHHRKRGFAQELRLLVERHGLEWRDDKTAEAVPIVS
jgi:putative transposase